jgi:glycosyltransferase involved in cell wall biosynthesis
LLSDLSQRERHVVDPRSRPIRILFNVFADEDNYNAQSLNAREIALRLDPARFCSTLFFERKPDPRLTREGIRLVRLAGKRKTLKILKEMFLAHDFILYIDLSPASYLYLHLPRRLRRSTRAVLSIEGSRGNLDGVSATVRRYADYVVRHADIRIAISKFLASELNEIHGYKADFIIPVGVDTHLFHPPGVRDHATLTVLFVGHLIERKGPQLVLEAARQFPQVRFRIVGQARDDFGRNFRIQASEAAPNVTVESPVPQFELAKIMRSSDVLLLPSRVEGIPKVTLEAASTGLPCIVFDDYQTPSVVDGKTGFQVKTFPEMLERLRILISDSSLRARMQAASIEHVRSFDWDEISSQWNRVFCHDGS